MGESAVGQGEDLFGAVGPGPVVRLVIVGQRRLVARKRNHAPSGLPAMTVQGVRMIPEIPPQSDFAALEVEHTILNAVGERHQREGAGFDLGEGALGCRAKDVLTLEGKARHRSADLRRDIELHAALRQCDHPTAFLLRAPTARLLGIDRRVMPQFLDGFQTAALGLGHILHHE